MQATSPESTITMQLPESSEPRPVPRARRWAEALGWSPGPGRLIAEFCDAVGRAAGRDEVHCLLLRAAQQLTGAVRVEIRPVGGPNRVLLSRSIFGRESDDALRLPIRFRGEVLGTLAIGCREGRRIPPAMIVHLETLCAIAAIGDRLLGRERHLRMPSAAAAPPATGPDGTLMPFLRQLVLLSRRRKEPLGLLAIGLSRPGRDAGPSSSPDARRDDDPEVDAVLRTLRESDLVVPFDDRTLIAVLPNASTANTAMIAESVARSMLEASGWSELPRIAIGAACYPEDAKEADLLLDVALDALRRSREEGLGQIVPADRAPFLPRIFEESGAGAVG